MVTPKGADLIVIKKDRFLNPVENFFFFLAASNAVPCPGIEPVPPAE